MRRAAVAVLISVLAGAWFVLHIEWGPLGAALGGVALPWVAAASGILLFEFVLRAWRWRVLLRPLGANARTRDLFIAQIIGAAANTLLPLRAGEIAKPLVASRRTGHPISGVVATAVMERVYDLLGLVSVLVVMVAVLPEDPGEGELVFNLKLYGGLLGGVALACMAVFFALTSKGGAAARGVFARIVAIAPGPIARRFLELFDGFVVGLGNSRDWRGMLQAGGLSIWLWLDGAAAIWCLFQAFGMPLPFGAACFTGVAIALTVVLPQAPGFIGPFHLAMEKTMLLWGQSAPDAQGFAILFWAVSFLPVTAVGLLAMAREGLSLGSLTDLNTVAERAGQGHSSQ